MKITRDEQGAIDCLLDRLCESFVLQIEPLVHEPLRDVCQVLIGKLICTT
jgi:hypothetical protein